MCKNADMPRPGCTKRHGACADWMVVTDPEQRVSRDPAPDQNSVTPTPRAAQA